MIEALHALVRVHKAQEEDICHHAVTGDMVQGAGRAKAAQSDMVLPRTRLRSTLQATVSVPARWVRSDCVGPCGAEVSLPL